MAERKPHLLHVILDWGWSQGVRYSLECPHADLGAERPCALWEECEHQPPQEPESEEPAYSDWRDPAAPKYAPESDPAIVAEWEAFWEKHEEWEESHPHGAWERIDACWAADWVKESGYEDGWSFEKGFVHEVTVGPMPVDIKNDGAGFDDSSLIITSWKEDSDGE